ncbi:MAG: DUF3822 family protein [Bacteroidales bacterium]|nr:DUF3822 family protein [Bacteroidales bacterium]
MHSYKCALVPDRFFDPSKARAILAETVDVDDSEEVAYVNVPFYNAVLIYVCGEEGTLPELHGLLEASRGIDQHNRIVASWLDGRLHLVVARDGQLLLCNSFKAPDFTTAQYYIFLVLSRFQLNPEVSTIYFHTNLTYEDELSLYRYFRSVEHI